MGQLNVRAFVGFGNVPISTDDVGHVEGERPVADLRRNKNE